MWYPSASCPVLVGWMHAILLCVRGSFSGLLLLLLLFGSASQVRTPSSVHFHQVAPPRQKLLEINLSVTCNSKNVLSACGVAQHITTTSASSLNSSNSIRNIDTHAIHMRARVPFVSTMCRAASIWVVDGVGKLRVSKRSTWSEHDYVCICVSSFCTTNQQGFVGILLTITWANSIRSNVLLLSASYCLNKRSASCTWLATSASETCNSVCSEAIVLAIKWRQRVIQRSHVTPDTSLALTRFNLYNLYLGAVNFYRRGCSSYGRALA